MISFPLLPVNNVELKKVNDRLANVLDFLYDIAKNTDEPNPFFPYFPPLVYLQNPDKCIRSANELILMIEDDFVHSLPPLHQHVLYEMLQTAQEIYSDMKNEKSQPVENIEDCPECIDEIDEETDFSLDNKDLDAPSFYLDYCFEDIDFLSVAEFFYLYKNNYKHYLEMGVGLDQFVALMPNDIREEYENIKREKTSNS